MPAPIWNYVFIIAVLACVMFVGACKAVLKYNEDEIDFNQMAIGVAAFITAIAEGCWVLSNQLISHGLRRSAVTIIVGLAIAAVLTAVCMQIDATLERIHGNLSPENEPM